MENQNSMKCLFCQSDRIAPTSFPRPTSFNHKIFNYRKCLDCDLVFIDPVPDTNDYNRMYANSYHDEFYFKESPDYTEWFDLFEKYSREKSIVDYGCGDGSFVRFFKQKGYETIGVEYDHALVERLRKENPGITFYTVDEFWALQSGVLFNAIFLGDVLEHMAMPSDFLKKLAGKLKPGGLIAAMGPLENNTNFSLAWRKAVSGIKKGVMKNSMASHVPYHIFFSNARNQKDVFEQAGLRSKFYRVFEIAWPYPSKFQASAGKGLNFLVAKTSMILSRTLPGKMGNRFLYIGEKK